ncbi:MAG: hypothetical protein V4723_13905 [Pseudomonadota bacterium]
MKTMSNDGNFDRQQPVAKQLLYVVLGTLAILSVPLIAMQFSSDVDWDGLDFAIIGVLLMSIGSIYVFTSRLVRTRQQRIILGFGLAFVLFLCWAELAVGVFGSPFAGS